MSLSGTLINPYLGKHTGIANIEIFVPQGRQRSVTIYGRMSNLNKPITFVLKMNVMSHWVSHKVNQ